MRGLSNRLISPSPYNLYSRSSTWRQLYEIGYSQRGIGHGGTHRGNLATRFALVARAPLRRLLVLPQVVGGIDQGDMGKRLWKVTDHTAAPRVVFLGEQAEIVAQRQQTIEQGLCLVS